MNDSPWITNDRLLHAEQMRAFRRESGGIMRAFLIDPETTLRVLFEAIHGDPEAKTVLRAVDIGMAAMEARPPEHPARCLFCTHAFADPVSAAAFVVFLPTANKERTDVGTAVVSPVCKACRDARTNERLLADAARTMEPGGEIVEYGK